MSDQELNPEQILANLEPGAPRREEAGKALSRLLNRLVSLRNTYRIEQEDQEEIVARAIVRVIERSPLPVVGKSDGECVNYLKKILLNLFVDMKRKQRRAGEVPLTPKRLKKLSKPQASDEDGLFQASRALLVRVLDGMCERARSDQESERLRRTWAQIHDLVYEDVDMRLILERDEGLGKEPSKADLKKVRDRALTQHKRFRDKMRATIGPMKDDGSLSGDEAEMVETLLEKFLLRRQNRDVGGV